MVDVTKDMYKVDFLICSNALAEKDDVVKVVLEPLDVYKEVEEATFEVVPDNDENSENIPVFEKENRHPSEPPSSTQRHTLYDIENMSDILRELTEDETIGWTKKALIRLIQVVNQTYDSVGKEYSNLYLGIVKSKMSIITSSERIISESYIHPDDIQKYRKWKKSKDYSNVQYFRTNYDVDLSLSKIKQILRYFYDFSNFLSLNREVKFGNYKLNPSEKAEMSGSRRSLRAHKILLTSP